MKGRWYGPEVWFGLHYDLHASWQDTDLGAHDDPEELAAALRLMNPQWVQTDCKGGAGLTSWFSKTPNASVAPGLKGDALHTWREATNMLGVPLHAHYMSLWDKAAWDNHPEWRADLKLVDQEKTQRLCPRSGYNDELVIPQMLEAIERYDVDGFWVDGESWAFQFCYCERCTAAYKQSTGKEPPVDVQDADWPSWINFQRDSVIAFTNHYIDTIHASHPEVLFTCDYSNSLRDPGEPIVKTDWLSADVWRDLDDVRQEARFMSTRGKPWDVMIWAFDRPQSLQSNHKPAPYNWRELEEMERQGVQVICQGGNFQVYENPSPLRDARLVPWRMQILGELGEFLTPRRELVIDTEPVAQVAVLDSEYHLRSQPVKDLFSYDISSLRGALYNLCDLSFGTDILDEWALMPNLDAYQLVVAPEQERMSEQMVEALKQYVAHGGRLILTGAEMVKRFGSDFIGGEARGEAADHTYFVPAGGQTIAIWSERWTQVVPTSGRILAQLLDSPLPDDRVLPYAAVLVHAYGSGKVAYIPADIFKVYDRDRRPLLRALVDEVITALDPLFTIQVAAPHTVDVVLRRKEGELQVHLLNKVEQVSGPISVSVHCDEPEAVELALEDADMEWEWDEDILTAEISGVSLHSALLIKLQECDSCDCDDCAGCGQ
ncbi:MAG: family 10 glycosylhydrolase [Anaerolineae bacterium]